MLSKGRPLSRSDQVFVQGTSLLLLHGHGNLRFLNKLIVFSIILVHLDTLNTKEKHLLLMFRNW